MQSSQPEDDWAKILSTSPKKTLVASSTDHIPDCYYYCYYYVIPNAGSSCIVLHASTVSHGRTLVPSAERIERLHIFETSGACNHCYSRMRGSINIIQLRARDLSAANIPF